MVNSKSLIITHTTYLIYALLILLVLGNTSQTKIYKIHKISVHIYFQIKTLIRSPTSYTRNLNFCFFFYKEKLLTLWKMLDCTRLFFIEGEFCWRFVVSELFELLIMQSAYSFDREKGKFLTNAKCIRVPVKVLTFRIKRSKICEHKYRFLVINFVVSVDYLLARSTDDFAFCNTSRSQSIQNTKQGEF